MPPKKKSAKNAAVTRGTPEVSGAGPRFRKQGLMDWLSIDALKRDPKELSVSERAWKSGYEARKREWLEEIEQAKRRWAKAAEELRLVHCAKKVPSAQGEAAAVWEVFRHIYFSGKFPASWKCLVECGEHEFEMRGGLPFPKSSPCYRLFALFSCRVFPCVEWLELPSETRRSLASSFNWRLGNAARVLTAHDSEMTKVAHWIEKEQARQTAGWQQAVGLSGLKWLDSLPIPEKQQEDSPDNLLTHIVLEIDWRFSNKELTASLKEAIKSLRGNRKQKTTRGRPKRYQLLLKGLALVRRRDCRRDPMPEKQAVVDIYPVNDGARDTFSGGALKAYQYAKMVIAECEQCLTQANGV